MKKLLLVLVEVLNLEHGKAKSVQQTTDGAGASPALRAPRPATVDVDCVLDGRGQLRPPLTGATTTGHDPLAVGRVDPKLTSGDPADRTISPGRVQCLVGRECLQFEPNFLQHSLNV